jgi:hypothetical protein
MPKSIEDIIPPSRRRMMDAAAATNPSNTPHIQPLSTPAPLENSSQIPSSVPPRTPTRMTIKTGRGFPYGTALIALLVIALSAGALYIFSGAKVEITPNTQSTPVSGDFTATLGSGDLPYNVIVTTKTGSASVPAESTETSNDSAQGTITISNAQSTAQTLINNTRFETPAGLIYRIHSPITIPAESSNATPGTVTATVYADQPGQQYNIGPSSFTVPGLQNSSSYTLVTAKSSSPISGGFIGTRASVSSSTDSTEQSSIQSALASTLQQQIIAKIPSGDVIVPGSTFANYENLPDSATTTTSVQISVQGTMTAVVFPQDALAKAIAFKDVGSYSGEPVTLDSVSNLDLTPTIPPASTTAQSDLTSTGTFNFSLNGNTTIIWKVDPTKIAGAVAGKTRDSAQQILSGFTEVNKAVLILRPFWATTFPADPSHIQVTVSNPASGS